jgi:hypothetical protein
MVVEVIDTLGQSIRLGAVDDRLHTNNNDNVILMIAIGQTIGSEFI